MDFGRAIRYHREIKGMEQQVLAYRVGVSPAYINKIEHGHKIPSVSVYAAIAKALGVTLDELADTGNGLADTQEVKQ